MKQNKDKKSTIIFFSIIFGFFVLFFIKIHPIIIFDTDDWLYSYINRVAYPMSSAWNPTRVFPETLFPFTILIGNNILSIFSSDFFNNTIIINSFVVSSFILFYIYSVYNLFKEKFGLKSIYNKIIIILFILLHFLIFRNSESNNVYMFYSLDACCYYYYLIPGLLNISLVINYIIYEKLYFKDNLAITSIIFLLCYLAIFSNLFHSIILASYIGINLLIKFIDLKLYNLKSFKKNIKSFITKNFLEILVLFSWFIVQFFELNGGRANSLKNNIGFVNMLKNSIKDFISMFNQLNSVFVIILLFSIIVSIYLFIKKRLFKNKVVLNSILSLLIIFVYLLLVCSKAGSWYITRPDVLIGILFYIFILICIVFTSILKKYNNFFVVFPLLLFILFFEINTSQNTFKESNLSNLSNKDVLIINNEIVRQIKKSSNNEQNIIFIPKFDSDDNWPIASYGYQRIIDSLAKHKIIKEKFTGNFEISDEYYKKILEGE